MTCEEPSSSLKCGVSKKENRKSREKRLRIEDKGCVKTKKLWALAFSSAPISPSAMSSAILLTLCDGGRGIEFFVGVHLTVHCGWILPGRPTAKHENNWVS